MEDDKKEKRKFRDTGFAKFMREKVGPVAGDVINLVGNVTGIEAIERVGGLLNARKEGDAQMAALASEFEMKKLEWQMEERARDHEYRMAEMQDALESFRLEVADKDSARSREIEFMRANGGKRDWLMGAVVVTGLALFVGVVAALLWVRIPLENQRLADMCFGAVMTVATSIFGYYVGSSRGSKMKDDVIRHAME
jgi:hypothetical protein